MAKPNFTNQTIWTGDNLPIMRGMNSACVDLIYLDPPFNSNANYAAPIGSLLDRVIKASSPKSGIILDPFCGCATVCIAAEKSQHT